MRAVRNLLMLAVVATAATWAYYTNVVAKPPAMDMSARVTGSASAFPVTLVAVERGHLRSEVTYTGSVAAFTEEDVYPRVTGRIVEMPVYPGDPVRAGQTVARLDDGELTSRVREAEAAAMSARANRAQMEAEVAAARFGIAQVEKELATTEAEAGYQASVATRDERLVDRGAISKQEAESSRALAAAAQARVAAARARLEQAKALEASALQKREVADAIVWQGQAQVKTSQVVHDYVNIRATTSGYVVKRLVAPGVLVQPGMAVLKIAQLDRVRLQANVGERDLAGIRVGSPVTVATGGGQPFAATVTSVFPFIDPGSRTAVVEAVVENPARRLLPGQYVQMRFVTGERPDALSVPREALVRLGDKASVWVVGGDRAERREVSTGLESAERVEILSGLQGGEQVVRRGQEALYADARVVDAAATPSPSGGHRGHSGAAVAPAAPAAGHAGHTASPTPNTAEAPSPSGHEGHGGPAAPHPPTAGGSHGAHGSH